MMKSLAKPLLPNKGVNATLPPAVSNNSLPIPPVRETNFDEINSSLKAEVPRETIPLYQSRLSLAKLSDDGRCLAIASGDYFTTIKDISSSIGEPHELYCKYAQIGALSKDKRWLATGHSYAEIEFRDISSEDFFRPSIKKLEVPPQGGSMCLEFSEDSSFLASASYDNTVIIWNLSEGTQKVLEGHSGTVLCIAFSIDGNYLASGSRDKTVRIWNVLDASINKVVNGHSEDVECVAFSPDVKTVASGSQDRTVIIWNLLNETAERVLTGHTSAIFCLSFSIDGKYIATGSYDQTVKIWNLLEGTEDISLTGHTQAVSSIAFMRDGKYLASCSRDDRTVITWKLIQDDDDKVGADHDGKISCLALSKDGKSIATGSVDFKVRVWNMLDEKAVQVLAGHNNAIECVAFSPDGDYLASGSEDNTARIWNIKDEKAEAIILGNHRAIVCALDFSRDGKSLVTACTDGDVRVWSIDGTLQSVSEAHSWFIIDMSYSKDKRHLATVGADRKAIIFDLSTQIEKKFVLRGHDDMVNRVAFSKDGNFLATSSKDAKLIIWNTTNGNQIAVLQGHSGVINCIKFSKDGRSLASASDDKTARIWNYLDGSETMLFEGHTGPITCLAYSKDGNYLVTAGSDNKAIIWNISQGTQEHIFSGHNGGVSCLKFSRDGKYLISTDTSSVRYWNFHRFTGNDSIKEISVVKYGHEFVKCAWINYLSKVGTTNYRSEFNDICILPHRINTLHKLAYDNRSDDIAQALSMGCPIIKSIYSESPITISLKRRTMKCLDKLLENIIQIEEKAEIIKVVNAILQDIPGIISSESTQIIPFLESLFRTMEPTFICPKDILPMTTYAHYFSPNVSLEFDDQTSNNTKKDPILVEISYSAFKWNLHPGSRDSIHLLESISNSRNTEVYRQKLVQTIIDIKWNQQSWTNRTLFILNMINLLFLLLMIFHEDLELALYIPSIGFIVTNSLFGIYEFLQAISSGVSYFRDSWNWLDIIKLPLCITCGILGILGDSHYILTALAALVCWVRGLAYFRTFKYTRIFVSMILTAIRDTSSFLILLLYVTVAYCSLFKTLDLYVKPEHKMGMVDTLKLAYELELGDFDAGEYSTGQYIIFVVASILNLIVMLNLLISILGDSYDKVQLSLVESDYSQKLEVILENEKMLFFNRSKGVCTYLHQCDVYRNEFSEMEWEGRIRLIQDSMQKVGNLISENAIKTNSNTKRLLLEIQTNLEQKIDEKLMQTQKEIYQMLQNFLTTTQSKD